MPGQNGGHPQSGLEKGGDKPGAGPGGHGGRDGQNGMPGGGQSHRYRRAQHKASICGEVGNVQHPVAQKEGHGHQGVLKAQLQGSLCDMQHVYTLLSTGPIPRHSRGMPAEDQSSLVVTPTTSPPMPSKTAGSMPRPEAVSVLTVMILPATW